MTHGSPSSPGPHSALTALAGGPVGGQDGAAGGVQATLAGSAETVARFREYQEQVTAYLDVALDRAAASPSVRGAPSA